MSQVPKNRKHSARATAMLPSHSRHGEPQGRWGSRAGHGWAAPAPRTRFLEWRQERRECSGDVNADIHGPCQARSRHGCSQQLTWGRSRGGGGREGAAKVAGGHGTTAPSPLPSKQQQSCASGAAKAPARCQPHELPWQGLPWRCGQGEIPPALAWLLPGTGKTIIPWSGRGAGGQGRGEPQCCRTASGPAPSVQPVEPTLQFGLNWGHAEFHTPPLCCWLEPHRKKASEGVTSQAPGARLPSSLCLTRGWTASTLLSPGPQPTLPQPAAAVPVAAAASQQDPGAVIGFWVVPTQAPAPKTSPCRQQRQTMGKEVLLAHFIAGEAKPQGLSLVSTEALEVERDLNELFPLQ